jgi:serine O-acetyltransferase
MFVRKLSILDYRFWSIVCGSSLSLEASWGGGLLIPHAHAIVIGPATLGPNCLVFQQVTIGTGSIPGWPKIGGHVDIGAGAKVLGGVVVGDHAKIGANAVVVQDVPAGATAVGIPARIILAPANEAVSSNGQSVGPSSTPSASRSLRESKPNSPIDMRNNAHRG